MNDNTGTAGLWDQISPDVFRQMVEVFANAGKGVLITPVPEDQLIDWEEDDSV